MEEAIVFVRKMTEVQAVIEARSHRLEREQLLASLATSASIEDIRALAGHLTFYVFGFQDMLRLTHEQVRDSKLRELVGSLREDDAGHEHWFMLDVAQLGCACDLEWVMGHEHQITRDVTYSLIAELLRAQDDRVRVVFPLVLEAAAAVFFPYVVSLLARSKTELPLLYFGGMHQDAEAGHELFGDHRQQQLAAIELDPPAFQAAVALVHRCFDLFERLFDHLEEQRQTRYALSA